MMSANLSRKNLRQALSLVRLTTVTGKSAPPLLGHVLLEGCKGRLRLSTTDLESWTQTELDGDHSVADAFRFCVPVAPLAAVVNRARTGPRVRLQWDGYTLAAAGESWPTLAAEEFPRRPVADRLHGTLDLVSPLRRVLPFVSADATRPAPLGGVHLEPEWLSATDGHRLARARIPEHGASEVILPRSWCAALLRAKPDAVTLIGSEGGGVLRAVDGVLALTTRGISGAFPPLENILFGTAPTPVHVELDRDDWLAAAEAAAFEAPERSRAVSVNVDRIGVHLTTALFTSCTPAICEDWSACAPLGFGVNADYLVEALRALPPGPLVLRAEEPLRPFELATVDGSVSFTIMPMRL